MKTAMEELLDMLQVQNPLRNQMLEKEKQQIIDAFNQGYRDSEIDAGIVNNHQDIELFANAEYYFNDKYKNVSK
jgi:predicted lipase